MSVTNQMAAIAAAKAPDVLDALKSASAATGSDFEYLLGTAMRESSLSPAAKSKSSSATGLFQFIDQTWLGLVKRHGAEYGLGDLADAISVRADGKFTVDSSATKQSILSLRNDAKLSALMAGEAAEESRATLSCALGRDVCAGELYAAHFFGTGGAKKLISLYEQNPNARADVAFPDAASANRSVFYHRDGTPKTIGEVYSWAVRLPNGAGAVTAGAAKTVSPAATRHATPGLRGMTESLASTEGFAAEDSEAVTQAADDAIAASYAPVSPRGGFFGHWAAGTSGASNAMPSLAFLMTPGVVEILASLAPASGRETVLTRR